MSFQIGDTISDIQLNTQTVGVRIGDIDIISAYKKTNEYLNSIFKMPTTERTSDLLTFPGVYEYAAPSDFIGWMEPRRPYGIASPWFVNTTENELVHTYAGRQTAFKFNRENLFFIVSDSPSSQQADENGNITTSANQVIVNECDSLTENGTFAISGDGSGLVINNQIFVSGSGSLQFTVTDSGGMTTVTITGMSQVDLTNYITAGFLFINLQCPNSNTSAITNVVVKIGNDASNYYSMSGTTWYRGDAIQNGWGQIGLNFLNATETGVVVDTAIDYFQIVLTNGVSGTSGTYRLDSIFAALPNYYELPYYSKNNIKTASGVYQQYPTATTDTILCPEDANSAYFYKALEMLAYYNLNDSSKATYFANQFMPFENLLRIKYPSQERKTQTQWYRSGRF